jgi:N utilization substance protein A
MDLKTFGQSIRELAEEKSVPEEKIIETIELAVAAAYKKDYGKKTQIIRAKFNPETGALLFSQIKIVVDDSLIKSEEEIAAEEAGHEPEAESVGTQPRPEPGDGAEKTADGESPEGRKIRFNPERHIMVEDARRAKADAQPGEELEFPLEEQHDFGRIASQTAKQVIIQKIREAEREATYTEYKSREGEIVSGIVQRIEGRNVFLDLGRGVGLLPFEEQIPRERYVLGERIKALVLSVEKEIRGPGILLSRSHPRFLIQVFGLEVPEIASGAVEIKAVAREPGSRSKVAVASNDPAIDPVGSMVGQRGVRVSTVINEIGGEKIDIIEWAEDPARFIANALAPAKVLEAEPDPSRRDARVVVPDDQLSLAIGKGGQNVRLAAKLTGWRIDVRSPASSRTMPSADRDDAGDAEKAEPAEAVVIETEEKPLAEKTTPPQEAAPGETPEGVIPKNGTKKKAPKTKKKSRAADAGGKTETEEHA